MTTQDLINKIKQTTTIDIINKKEIDYQNEKFEIIMWANERPFPHITIQLEDLKNNKTLAYLTDIETIQEYNCFIQKITKILSVRN